MTKSKQFCLILSAFLLVGCGAVEKWVQSAPRMPASPLEPVTEPPTIQPSPLPAVPGYAISSAGKTLQGSNYKLRVRVGGTGHTGTLNGAHYTLRTGKTRQLKDM